MGSLWLESEIATQLEIAQAWLTRSDGSTDKEWEKLRLYEDSGSSLRIFVRVPEERRNNCLRILNPLTLTDGAASIEASLSDDCHKSLRAQRLHTPFAVRRYTLQYTPYGPPRHRISFTLNSVDPDYRADTSKETFGDLRPIHLCEDVDESANKLRQLRIDADRRCFGTVDCQRKEQDRMSPMGSPGEEASNEGRYPDTQMAYGTQVAHRTRTPGKTPERGAEPTLKTTGDESARTALLGLLNPRTAVAAPSTSFLTREPPIVHTEGVPSGPRTMRQSQPSDNHPRVSNIFLSPTRSDAPKAPSAGGFARTSLTRASNEGFAPHTDRMQPTRLPPSYPRQNAPEKALASVTMSSALEDLEPEWLRNTCRADGCGRVPAPQQKLLSSWQKQRAGTNDRFPHANVPIHLFNAIKQFKVNAASSDSESSDGDSSASDTHSCLEEETADGDTEVHTDLASHVPPEENVGSSDEEDSTPSTPIPWSSSPVRESPKAPFKPGHILPPDSSLPDQNSASQREPQELSPVQEAQRVVIFQPSGEENMSGPRLSPAQVFDGDDSDMDMEMDLPRGLEESSAVRNIPPSATANHKAAVVQVKETPYPKIRNPASPHSSIPAAQVQHQTSSGTSGDTSSTSIVLGTYHEPSSSLKSITHGIDVMAAQSTALVSSYNGQEEIVEHVDVPMKDANDEPPQPSLDFNSAISPPSPFSDLHSRLDPNHAYVDDGTSPFVSPGLSPMSGQRSHSRTESNVVSHAKRKFEHSPTKQTRVPSRRGKTPRFNGFPERSNWRDELEIKRKADYDDFIQKERTASLASTISAISANPDARPGSPHSPQGPHRGAEKKFEDLQTRSVTDVTSGHQNIEIDQTRTQSWERSPNSASGGVKLQAPLVPNKATSSIDQIRSPSPTPAPQLPEDVVMEMDDIEAENSNTGRRVGTDDFEADDSDIETNQIEYTEVNESINDQVVSGYDGSQHLQPQSDISDPPLRTAGSAKAPKDVRPEVHPSKSTTIFEDFKAKYPAYTGDIRHFLGQCKQMEKLDEQDKMVPKWQWDDFIIRNRTDYRDYANQCLDNGEDADPYYRFYKDNIRDALYTKGIIGSRKTLAAAIRELEGGTVAKTTAGTRRNTVAEKSKSPSSRRSEIEIPAAKSAMTMAPTAEVPDSNAPILKAPISKTHVRSQVALEESSPVVNVQGKPRRSLPPAFNNKAEANSSTAHRPSKERAKPPFQASSSRGTSPLPSSKPAKQWNRLPTSHSASTRHPLGQRTSSGSRVSTESTGDIYRDFVFAMGRAKSFTGSDQIDSDPQKKWPDNLHVRPAAGVKRQGHDVLQWKDDL